MRTKFNMDENKLGFIGALLTAAFGTATFALALATPPISGPLATNPIQYPFTEIISRFPRDYIWMYSAMLLMLALIVAAVCIYHDAPEGKKIFAHTGLIFAVVSGIILFSDYFIQVSVIQPSLLNGETDGMALLTQYNPHGLFVVLEEIGYIAMSLSFLFFAPVFSRETKIDRAIRNILVWAFALSVLALASISIFYGIHREYLFEVAVISIDFLALIGFGILLSIRYAKSFRAE